MPSFFEEYLSRRERPEVVVDMDDYQAKLLLHCPTEQEAARSMLLQVENSLSDNIAAMIAAATQKPQKLMIIPSSPLTAHFRVAVNGGDVPNAWKPQSVLRQTALSMGKLGRALQMALSSVPNWHGSRLHITPAPKIWAEPATDGLVKMDRCGCGNSFKAGVLGKGLRMQDVGKNPYGAFDMDPDAQDDFSNLIKTLRTGFESKPKLVRMYFHAPKSLRSRLAKAGREAAVLRTAFIPPVPLKPAKESTSDDLWAVRVDERLLGLPIDGVYWPAEDEPLEIRHLELVKHEQTKESVSGDRPVESDTARVPQEDQAAE